MNTEMRLLENRKRKSCRYRQVKTEAMDASESLLCAKTTMTKNK